MRWVSIMWLGLVVSATSQGSVFDQNKFEQFCESLTSQVWDMSEASHPQFKEKVDLWVDVMLETGDVSVIIEGATRLGETLRQHDELWRLYLKCGLDVRLFRSLDEFASESLEDGASNLQIGAQKALMILDDVAE